MAKFAGADWLQENLKYTRPQCKPSPLGSEVADILGQVYCGIYHISREVKHPRCEWDNPYVVVVVIGSDLSTFDFDRLTKLVILCHDRAIRLCISGKANGYLELMFHQRERQPDDRSIHHPTIEDAVDAVREHIDLGVK